MSGPAWKADVAFRDPGWASETFEYDRIDQNRMMVSFEKPGGGQVIYPWDVVHCIVTWPTTEEEGSPAHES